MAKKIQKKKISIQMYLLGILILTIIVQGVIILGTLVAKDFYNHVDDQVVESFISRSNQQVNEINEMMTTNVKSTIESSKEISNIYKRALGAQDLRISDVDLSAEKFNDSHILMSKVLLNLLDKCVIDSAFVVLEDENYQETFSVEIKNVYPDLHGDGYQSYEMYTGSTMISKYYELGIHKDWGLTMDKEELELSCFTMPRKGMELEPYGTVEQYGYWNYLEAGSRNGEMTFTVPLLDDLGRCYGILGIGISQDYFADHYVNDLHYSYEDNFYAVGMDKDGVMILNDAMPNTDEAKEKLGRNFLISKKFKGDNVYSVNLGYFDSAIVKVDKLNMYSKNSPFYDQELSYMTVVDVHRLKQNSEDIKEIFAISFILALLIGIVISIILSRVSTLRINNLAKGIEKMKISDEIQFKKTGFLEIDKLTDAIKVLNSRIIKSSQTVNRLFELTELNLGAFESLEDGTVKVTEYVAKLLDLDLEVPLTIQEWNVHYKRLTSEIIDRQKRIYLYTYNCETCYIKVTQTITDGEFIGMVLDVTKEIEDVLEAQYKLDYDALTGLYSRTAFYRKAIELIESDPYKTGCVVFIDLDNLKFVNDTFGHDYGDLYLKEGSKIFNRIAKGNGLAARMSGDEFAIYLHGYYSKDEIRQLLYMHFEDAKYAAIDLPDGTVQRVRFSSGIAWYSEDSKDINELVKYADFAMYDAKHTTKGTHREFNRDVYDEKVYMMENAEAINELIEGQKVKFMFQPIVCLKTGTIYAYEALMRSDLDVFKSPAEILKVAANQFKLKELEHMLVEKVMASAFEKREEIGDAKIFINSIASQMIPEEAAKNLGEKYGDFLKKFVVEITEAEDNTPEKMKFKVDTIKSFGMQIAIDDFGSGYSNELRIIAIDPDVVKVDMELVQGISTDKDKQVLCENIINYCHERDIKTVCEGVENQADLIKIMELGTDLVQGYYVQRPNFDILPIPVEMKQEIIDISRKI